MCKCYYIWGDWANQYNVNHPGFDAREMGNGYQYPYPNPEAYTDEDTPFHPPPYAYPPYFNQEGYENKSTYPYPSNVSESKHYPHHPWTPLVYNYEGAPQDSALHWGLSTGMVSGEDNYYSRHPGYSSEMYAHYYPHHYTWPGVPEPIRQVSWFGQNNSTDEI
eukprot:235778-Amorphochlora_amoeboformis.AAC.1